MFDQTWMWTGTYCKTDKNLGVPLGEIRERLAQLPGNAAYWLKNKTYDVDQCAVRFHYELVVIHPFPNGNGRHARLLADVVAVRGGRPEFSWGGKKLTASGEARNEYLRALRTADTGDFAQLLQSSRA
jgi:Fic-DOC domain mobile mystery protein B